MSLDPPLNQRLDLWRGSAVSAEVPRGTPTGFAALDGLLPWRGWPPAALVEILDDRPGGGLALARPALETLSHGGRWLLLVDPPFVPYAPALAASGVDLSRLVVVETAGETAWTAEQALRSGACAAVLAWGGRGRWPTLALRRLQLAARTGEALALLFRPVAAGREHSPAVLRLRVQPAPAGMTVEVLKQRGGRPGAMIVLPLLSAVEPAPLPSLIANNNR
ncbi:MAG: translesion DNA synthesis-associated protein ImuA [Chromatiaceae bacterium]|jgi:cell division inhibitor SulA|nr:translesion DNA synthesis-associated protein ImuA [Chromatiaceae bacterium]